MKNRIVKILVERDGMSLAEAISLFNSAKREFMSMIDDGSMDSYAMDEFCQEWFGLEPDFIDDIIYLPIITDGAV